MTKQRSKRPVEFTFTPELHLDYNDHVRKTVQESLRHVYLATEIGRSAYHAIANTIEYLASLNKKPITLTVNTYGGEIDAGLGLYDFITQIGRTVPIDIVATGACMSMGTVVLQAARRRYATPYTQLMLHELRGVNEGSLGQLRDSHKHMERLQTVLNTILSRRSGLSTKELTTLIERKDVFITADEALKFNLIDEIVATA